MARTVISVNGVTKDFKLPHEKTASIKSGIVHIFKKKDKSTTTQHALRGVSFDIKEGEFFGILGRNGSGKSTLLKILAEIYRPTKGSVQVDGKLVPFIELGVGFNPDLTGRENVYLNGALLGFSKKEIDERYDEIVEFAELEEFMDQKLKNYSSGMQVRLAFSVATRADADILLVDEVLAVGDEAFQRKCNDYFFKLKRDKKTVILVTHSMENVRQFCDRAALIDEGVVKIIGNADKVASAYSDMFISEYVEKVEGQDEATVKAKQISDVTIKKISVKQNNKASKVLAFREDFSIEIALESTKDYVNLASGLHIIDQAGRAIVALSTKSLPRFDLRKGVTKVRFDLKNILAEGEYYLAFAVEEKSSKTLLLKESELSHFSIVGLQLSKYSNFGLTHPDFTVTVEENESQG